MDDDINPKDPARYWRKEIEIATEAEKSWRGRAEEIMRLYRDDRNVQGAGRVLAGGKRFNILWANTETLRPALYARTAKPDVRRRFRDENPIARQAATLIERALSYCVDAYDIDRVMEAAVQDTLLVGRGVVWLEYRPVMASQTVPEMGMDGQIAMVEREYIAEQKLMPVYVPWQDFRVSPARTWTEKRWVARRHLLDKKELKKEFPKHPDVPLDWKPEGSDYREEERDERARAVIWEIWHQDKRERVWIANGYDEVLDREDDPYGLEQFYPLPEPMYGVQMSGSLVPVPEYTLYQDQASELDELTARINKLVKALKRRGLYNGAIKELAQLADSDDNQFVPVADYATLMEKGGLAQAFQTEDLTPISNVLGGLYTARNQVMDEIYQITGISELLRGVAEKGETATSARIRGTFGSLRLKERQQKVQRFVRDLYRLKAEIIAEHFDPQILQTMTGLQVDPQAIQILREDRLRSYAVDIETDSTVFEDAEAEKQARVEFLTAMGQFVNQWGPAVAQEPLMAPLAMEAIKFGVRGFKVGREMEDVIERTAQQIVQKAQQPPPPDPKAAEAQAKLQIEQAKLQMQGQKMQAEMAMKQSEAMSDAELEVAKLQIEAELDRRKQDMDYILKLRDQELSHQVARLKAAQGTETRQ